MQNRYENRPRASTLNSQPAWCEQVVALECAGLTGGFYTAWNFEVFFVPGFLWMGVFVYYLYRRVGVGDAKATAKAINDAFFVLFLMYPLVGFKRRLATYDGDNCNTVMRL